MNFLCPLCQTELIAQVGNVIHPGDPKFGANLYCPARHCEAQEVMGHSKTHKEAYEIILSKYKKS
jgi:hypothetical protein